MASLVVVGLMGAWALRTAQLTTPTPIPEVLASGWLLQSNDLQAFRPVPSAAQFETDASGPHLRLSAGEVRVSFHRQAKDPTLRVETPELRLIVRGTVFAVRRSDAESTVSVDQGLVEVIPNAGPPVLVGAGESLQVTATQVHKTALSTKAAADLRASFASPQEPSTAPTPAPASPPAVPTRQPPPAAPSRLTPNLVTTAERLKNMQARWQNGERDAVLRELSNLLDHLDDLDPAKAETRYLAATLLREQGDLARAIELLKELYQETPESPLSPWARLERLRLLGSALQRRAEALVEVDALLALHPPAAVAEPASFERCALLIELLRHDDVAACLEGYLASFENGPHAGEAAILLKRTRATLPEASPPR